MKNRHLSLYVLAIGIAVLAIVVVVIVGLPNK